MASNIEQIAANWIQLLPQFYNKVNNTNAILKKQSDLTHLQFRILEELYQEKSGIGLTQLAKAIGISKQQLNPLINKLEKLNYVKRIQSTLDKRTVKLSLEKAGEEVVSKLWGDFHKILSKRFRYLSQEDLADLDYALTKFQMVINKLDN